MKISIQAAPKEFELNDNQLIKLRQIGMDTHYYWTTGLNGELLDELTNMGLVRSCGHNEQYQLTDDGELVFAKIPANTPKDLPDED